MFFDSYICGDYLYLVEFNIFQRFPISEDFNRQVTSLSTLQAQFSQILEPQNQRVSTTTIYAFSTALQNSSFEEGLGSWEFIP
jgi:hypothetical protein